MAGGHGGVRMLDGRGGSGYISPMGPLVLVFPVKPFRGFRLIDPVGRGAFGAPRDNGKRRHLGVDLTAVPGDDLVAPISGRVELVGWAYPDADLGSLTIKGDGVSVKI